MKTPHGTESRPRLLAAALLGATLSTAYSATLAPVAVGESEVTAIVAGRANLALASGGGAAFSSSDLTPAYAWDRVNDGVRDGSGNSWIPATTGGTEFVAVKLPGATSVGAVAWSGQPGYDGRSAGTWVLQYTTDASPTGGSTWTEIGTYVYSEPACNTPMQRTCFSFTPVANVTAIRLLVSSVSCGLQAAVQEMEIYEPLSVTPTSVGKEAVAAAIAGRPNFALASGGATAFSSSDLGPNYSAPDVNNGVTDDSGFSWIPASAASGQFVGVGFALPANVDSVVWQGQTAYNGRSGGTYSLEYTKDTAPGAASAWISLGAYTYAETGCAAPMPRSLFSFPPLTNVTGIRLVITSVGCGIEPAVQELEAYGPLVNAPSISAQPTGGTYMEGSVVTLTVMAEGASAFKWYKNGGIIAGATGSSYTILNLTTNDAGTYTVTAINSAGETPSDPAVIAVTPAPVYATYAEAVLTDNPIHYYPMDETSGTVATDLGTLAVSGGTYAGGFTLGQASATSRLGKAVRFDGSPGTWVDLGSFHPGDAVTIEAWASLDPAANNNPSYNALVARWDGSYELDVAPGDIPNLVIKNQVNAFGMTAFSSAITRGQWFHIVGVYANNQITVWINGVQGPTASLPGTLQNAGPTPDRVLIGATREGIFQWKGWIDEVAIYDTGLSAAQIRNHYRAGLPGTKPPLTIQQAVLVSWPTVPPGYTLQSAPKVEGPYTPVIGTPIIQDGLNKITVLTSPEQMFFKLDGP